MAIKKTEFTKDWRKFKLVQDIHVFLSFANFYWQFIQGFSRIVASLNLGLKTIVSLDKQALGKNNGNKPVFSENNSNKPAFEKNNGNYEVIEFDNDNVKHTKK